MCWYKNTHDLEHILVDYRKPDFVAVGFPSVVYAPKHASSMRPTTT
jgi:hypothetical protein